MIDIVAGNEGASEASTADFVVDMFDVGYDVPTQINAGAQTWEVVNAGLEPHP